MTGYEGRIGRYTAELASAFLDVAGVRAGQRALDVGCGTGALTAPLARCLGAENVAGVDPDAESVTACAARLPGVDVRLGRAEALPFGDGDFDAVLAQLVLGLLTDAHRGVAEMHRVARHGATVAACVWDFGGGMTVLRSFWDAALALDPAAAQHDQARTRACSTPDELEALWTGAGLRDVTCGPLVVGADYRDLDDLWHPLECPDGAPGRYAARLDEEQRAALRRELTRRLGNPVGPFRLTARAWYVRGRA